MFPIFVRLPWWHVTTTTLWFVVVYKGEISETTRRHEIIHYKQFNELWVIGFLWLYVWDWVLGAFVTRGKIWPDAYHRIRFEQEAYDNAFDEKYLETREKFAWRRYTVRE